VWDRWVFDVADPGTHMDSEAVTQLAGSGRVPHGSSDDPDVLDFSANTNPEVPPGVAEVYADALDAAGSYPNDAYPDYSGTAAVHVSVDCEREVTRAQVVVTPGGLAAVRLALAVAVDPGDSVLVPAPSFGEYAREVELQGGDPVVVPHAEVLDRDPADHAVAVVCTPNNPTGDVYERAALRVFADRCADAETLLLVDEAFLGFTDEPSLAGRPGVVVARSLTKLFGLPGLRAGFAVATGTWRDRLRAARQTWNLGGPAAAVGAHCMADRSFVAETCERVAAERARLCDRLAENFDVYTPGADAPLREASAPFLLLDTGSSERVDETLAAAREAGLALRDARTFRGLDSHLRVAVRRPAANDRLLEALTDV
jgi:histidinol-phosphate/aromatic aminotransferase/cobyric acid decarboxylase-like protein